MKCTMAQIHYVTTHIAISIINFFAKVDLCEISVHNWRTDAIAAGRLSFVCEPLQTNTSGASNVSEELDLHINEKA